MSEQATQKDWNSLDDEEFRGIAAAFFQRHVPQHLRHLSRRPRWAEVKDWYLTL